MDSVVIILKTKEEINIERFTSLAGDDDLLVVSDQNERDHVYKVADIARWVLYTAPSGDRAGEIVGDDTSMVGKLVVVSHWSDFKLEDATKLGILREVKDGYFYINEENRGYRYCREVGKAIDTCLSGGEVHEEANGTCRIINQ